MNKEKQLCQVSFFSFLFFHSPLLSARDNTLSDTLRNSGGFSVIKISAGKHSRTLGKRGDQHTLSSTLHWWSDFDQLNSISGQDSHRFIISMIKFTAGLRTYVGCPAHLIASISPNVSRRDNCPESII